MLTIIDESLTIVRIQQGPGIRYRIEAKFKIVNSGGAPIGPVHIHISKYENGGYGYGGILEETSSIASVAANSTSPEYKQVKVLRNDTLTQFTGHFRIELRNSPDLTTLYTAKQVAIGNTGGCRDTASLNFSRFATSDDGSCLYAIYGCTDPSAVNYDPTATHDNGTCVFEAPPVNTGMKAYATLEQYDTQTGQATGRTKDNVPEDPDYVPPFLDETACPIGQ